MASRSRWSQHDVEGKIRMLLSMQVYNDRPDHHLGRPFVTAYTLAIMFAREYPTTFNELGMAIGGRGSDVGISLPQYIANQLSRRITNNQICDIEGGFLSDIDTMSLSIDNNGEVITSSVNQVSIFRLRE